jgi:hypothetical protein
MGTKVTVDELENILNSSGVAAINDNLDRLADEFDSVHYRDGSQAATGDWDMDSNRILNLPAPVSANEPVRLVDFLNGNSDISISTTYASTAEGLANTDEGELFLVDAGGGTVTVYVHSAGGVATAQYTMATSTALAAESGAGLIGFNPGATGDVARTVQDKLRDFVSVMDFIPVNLQADIRAGTSTTDVSSYIQAADDYMASLNGGDGGGGLYFPLGKYRLNAQINKNMWVSWCGAGVGTNLEWDATYGLGAGTHSGIRMDAGLNGGAANPIVIEFLGFVHLGGRNAAGTRIGFYDTGSHNISFRKVGMEGWKYDFVLDQTEVATFTECECSGYHNYWFVNTVEAELGNVGELSAYTNGNKIIGGNMSPAGYGIIHDGGELFTVEGVNCNSGTFIRAAGVSNLRISDNYIEGNSGSPIVLAATTLNGVGVGSCSAVKVQGNLCGLGAFPFINVLSAGLITMQDNVTSGAGAPWIGNAQNAAAIWTQGNAPLGGREIMTAAPVYFQDIGEKSDYWASVAYDAGSLALGASDAVQTLGGTGVDNTWCVEAVQVSAPTAGIIYEAQVVGTDIKYWATNRNGANPTDPGAVTLSFLLRKKY